MIGDTATRVLLAVAWSDRPTVPGLAAELGLSRSTVHFHLTSLRNEGLVTWEDGKRATLRSTVVELPFDFRYNKQGQDSGGRRSLAPRSRPVVEVQTMPEDDSPTVPPLHEGGR